MALIVEFEVPTDKFALSETLRAVPDATLEVGRVVADAPDSITAYLWARAPDFDALEAALEADPTVRSLTVLSEASDERSYRMTWNEPIDLLVHVLTEQQGTVIHAANRGDAWALRVSFPEGDALEQAQELKDLARRNEFSLDVRGIHRTDEYRGAKPEMTRPQQEALMAAFEAGYFEVPKGVTLAELAEAEGVSHQAMSERIRRGVHYLIEQTLVTGGGSDTADVDEDDE